jgi:hypothetical protein
VTTPAIAADSELRRLLNPAGCQHVGDLHGASCTSLRFRTRWHSGKTGSESRVAVIAWLHLFRTERKLIHIVLRRMVRAGPRVVLDMLCTMQRRN